MLELLKVHGFRTLINTEIRFDPLTIMIGKNGVGKTSILDSLQLLGNFSRGGIDRAFGPPPWSLSWQRTKGLGYIPTVRFELQMKTEDRYNYVLSLSEKAGTPLVTEERLMHPDDNRTVASLGPGNQPAVRHHPESGEGFIRAGDRASFRHAQVGHQLRTESGVHLSWGDRQLMGLLCILYVTAPGATIAIEEIDRGFNPARYTEVIEVLSEAAYDGLDGRGRIQIVVTTHSPSFLNRLDDRLAEIRLVTRVAQGATVVKPLLDVTRERMGTDAPESSVGELWESGLLEDLIA